MKTSPEHPALISPLKGSGLCGGVWPECSPAVVPATVSFSLAVLARYKHLLTIRLTAPPVTVRSPVMVTFPVISPPLLNLHQATLDLQAGSRTSTMTAFELVASAMTPFRAKRPTMATALLRSNFRSVGILG